MRKSKSSVNLPNGAGTSQFASKHDPRRSQD
jgi:hypothetical protein